MRVHAYFRKAFGFGFDIYGSDVSRENTAVNIDLYLGPWTVELESEPRARGIEAECRHEWTNWDAPTQVEAQNYAGILSYWENAPTGTRTVLVQRRCCIKCNLNQQVRVS